MSNGSDEDFFQKVKELALELGYDGLPPGDGGPDFSIYTEREILSIQYEMEYFVLTELSARRRMRGKHVR